MFMCLQVLFVVNIVTSRSTVYGWPGSKEKYQNPLTDFNKSYEFVDYITDILQVVIFVSIGSLEASRQKEEYQMELLDISYFLNPSNLREKSSKRVLS